MGYLNLSGSQNRRLTAFKETAEEFGKNIVRPAGIALDKLHDPSDVIKKESILWEVFRGFRERGLHKVLIPKAFGGLAGYLP